MGTERIYELRVHYCNIVDSIADVDPDRYSYMDLLTDVNDLMLKDLPSSLGIVIVLYYTLPGTNVREEITSDNSLLDMFALYENSEEIHVFLETGGAEPTVVSYPKTNVEAARNDSRPGTSRAPESESDSDSEDGRDEELHHTNDDSDSEDNDWEVREELSETDEEASDEEPVTEDDQLSEDELSNCDDEDENPMYKSDDNLDVEAVNVDKYMRGKLFEHRPGETIELYKGLLFEDVNHFRNTLRDYCIQTGFKLVRDRNEKNRVAAHCGNPGCSWRIFASPIPDGKTYKIKSLGPEHSCVMGNTNKEANSTWIAQKLLGHIRGNPDITIDGLQELLLENYGVEAHRMQLYRAKKKALEKIEGSHAESYKKLWMYGHEVMKTNPGSLFKLETQRVQPNLDLPHFHRLFFSFAAVQNGFKDGCRPFLAVDGCHLKGPYGGVLLSAVGLDGNNGLFPMGFAVVESENTQSWRFFLHHLYTIIGDGPDPKPWVIMSDGQKGIEIAVADIIPHATHRRCCRHLFCNFRSRYPGMKLKSYFWSAAKAYNVDDFKLAMRQMEDLSLEAAEWLKGHKVESWARYTFDPAVKNEQVTSNVVESFNNWLGKLRGKPVLSMIDHIRTRLMVKVHERFEKATSWEEVVTPRIMKKCKLAVAESRCYKIVMSAGGTEFEVSDLGKVHVVNLVRRSCCCRVWDLTGIPCKHAAACINTRRLNVVDFMDKCYSRDTYLKAYGHVMHPLHDETHWEPASEDPLQPPPFRRLPGRPRKERKRAADEPSREGKRSCTLKCGNCKQFGHNKRTCQRAPVGSNRNANAARPVRGGRQGRGSQGKGSQGRGNQGRGSEAGCSQIGCSQISMNEQGGPEVVAQTQESQP